MAIQSGPPRAPSPLLAAPTLRSCSVFHLRTPPIVHMGFVLSQTHRMAKGKNSTSLLVLCIAFAMHGGIFLFRSVLHCVPKAHHVQWCNSICWRLLAPFLLNRPILLSDLCVCICSCSASPPFSPP
eukprot:GGOE01026069.1.p2 GENE.GGOE01026069.1~~GGOE01026069.1.p2  ORF type:complete len:126 (+),score=5.85 GGOE01026069.1:196-573(+)